MINDKDLLIMSQLRKDARMSLTKMSKKTQIPISTLFDKLRQYEGHEIQRHIALLDFAKLGYTTRAIVLMRVHKKDKETLGKTLVKNTHINSLFKVNNGFDFQFECIFRDMRELEDFVEGLEEQFAIKGKEVHYIIEEIKREEFLCEIEQKKKGTSPSEA